MVVNTQGSLQTLIEKLRARINELEEERSVQLLAIDKQQARIEELEAGVAFLTDAIENGDEIIFIPERK